MNVKCNVHFLQNAPLGIHHTYYMKIFIGRSTSKMLSDDSDNWSPRDQGKRTNTSRQDFQVFLLFISFM